MTKMIVETEHKIRKHRAHMRRSVVMLAACIGFGLVALLLLEPNYESPLSPASLVDMVIIVACALGCVVYGLRIVMRREQLRRHRRRLKHLKEVQALENQFRL